MRCTFAIVDTLYLPSATRVVLSLFRERAMRIMSSDQNEVKANGESQE